MFLARIVNNGWAAQPRGIGIDEETALLVCQLAQLPWWVQAQLISFRRRARSGARG